MYGSATVHDYMAEACGGFEGCRTHFERFLRRADRVVTMKVLIRLVLVTVLLSWSRSFRVSQLRRAPYRQSYALRSVAEEENQKTQDMNTALELSVSGLEDDTGAHEDNQPKKVKKKAARREVSKDPRDFSGYRFRDEEGQYDVPFIDEAMWFRLQVRKSSEKRFCENILELSKDQDSKWYGVVENAFYPRDEYPRFKGNQLTYSIKALIPGLVYIKTKMNYEIADDIESFNNVYGFSKTRSGIVLPLPKNEAGSLEDIAVRSEKQMDEKYSLLKKDEYVSIVNGPHEGKYGILQGTKKGKLEVILRGDYKDEWDLFDLKEVEYLENPPEKKWNEMSAKEAIESLMAKDPYNPTIKALKKEGVLADILYPDRKIYEPQPGTDRRIRSIAKADNKHKRESWTPQRERSEFDQSDSGDDDGFGEEDNEDLDDFLEGLLADGAIDSMLNEPESLKGAASASGGQSGDALEEWGTAEGTDRNTMWSALPSSGESLMELRSLASGDEDLESFFSTESVPEAASPAPAADAGPNINEFENFGDYLTAVVDHAKAGGGDKRNLLGTESGRTKEEIDDLDDLDDLLNTLGSFDGSIKESREPPQEPASSEGPDYTSYKIPELKALLKDRGLRVGGSKSELIQRLHENS